VKLRVPEPEPIGVQGDLLAAQQAQDDLQRLAHHAPLLARVDAEHHGVGGQQARPHAEHHPPARHVIELVHALGDHEGVVVGERDHAGAEANVPCAGREIGDEQLGAGDDLGAAGVMLADPGFLEAEVIEPFDQLAIAIEAGGGAFPVRVVGSQKDAEAQAGTEGHRPELSIRPPLLPS